MARHPRIHYEGALYHVTARGNNRDNIFHDGQDKAKYLALINRYKQKFAFRLYAYAIMDNHIHLLLEVGKNPLSKIMQGIQQSYTLYYNNKYCHVGHAFQQRYIAKLCNKDSYLLSIVKYIHYNPIKAGISKSLNYEWSSHRHYLGPRGIIDADFVLSLFADKYEEALSRYLRYMNVIEAEPTIPDAAYSEVQSGQSTVCYQDFNAFDLLANLCEMLNISIEDVCSSSRAGNVVTARKMFIYLALKNNTLNKELASILNINPSSVTRAFNSVLQDRALKDASEKLYRQYELTMQLRNA